MKHAAVALLLALLSTACERQSLELELPATPRPDAIDPRSPLDLARALDRVERGDPYDADDGYREVVRDFEGRRYRWRVELIAPLCRADRCNVLAFDREQVGQSWMPRLLLSPETRRALLSRCAGASPCPVEITARLAKLVASTEQFTSVTLDQVALSRETSAGDRGRGSRAIPSPR